MKTIVDVSEIESFLNTPDHEMARLRNEIARLQQNNEDLSASAYYWIRPCDAALERANECEARLQRRTVRWGVRSRRNDGVPVWRSCAIEPLLR